MNSYITVPSTVTSAGSTGYVTVDAAPATVVGGYVTDVATSAFVGSYVDSDTRRSTTYELAS